MPLLACSGLLVPSLAPGAGAFEVVVSVGGFPVVVRVVDVLVVEAEVGECVRAGGVGAAVDVEVLAGGRVVVELFGAEDVDELEELEELVVVGGLGGATPGCRPAPKARPIAWPGAGFRLAAPELL